MTVVSTESSVIAPGLIILFPGLGFLGLFCFAAFKRKWGLMLVSSGLVVLVFLAVFSYKVANNNSVGSQSADRIYVEPDLDSGQLNALPAVWSDGIEEEFEADVYYSKRAALRGIAGRVDRFVRQLALNGHSIPQELAIVTYKDEFGKDLLDEAVGILQEMLPDTECYTASAGKDSFTKAADSWISLELTESAAQPAGIRVNGTRINPFFNNDDFKNGQIKTAVHLKSRSRNFSVRFTEKPWLDNISAFKNFYPGRQWAVVYRQSCQAGGEILARAQILVDKAVRSELSALKGKPVNADFSVSNNDLSRHGIIADRFTQSFKGTSSTICRQALLLDISPDKIGPLAKDKLAEYNLAKQTWVQMLLSAIGVAFIICIVYLILNAATRGYYTVVLRILAVVGIIIIVMILLSFA